VIDISPAVMADLRVVATVLLAAFAMAHLLALVYVWTHRGLSYSQSFVQTLVMAGVVTAMMMLTIGNNIVWGIGMVGAMALVRFRTNLRDPRDMVFVFAALVSGIAAGTRAYALGAAGTVAFSLVACYLAFVPFGARKSFDGLLRYTAPWEGGINEAALALLQRHCRQFVLATVREVRQGEASEHVYHVRFRNDSSRALLAQELSAVRGLSGVAILLEDTRVEL
jgi:hypothetical protein